MELGILSLSDLQTDPSTGKLHNPATRTREIVSYGIAADQAGLDVFALGEHHSPDFAVANPAVPLAAIAQATTNIRLTSAVSVLSTLDPVRLHQDFASLDLVSDGRAEIIAGRSAFLEAFTLFGIDPADYDTVFAEKLDLLLAIRDNEHVTWTGRHRPALDGLPVPPRPQQTRLPLWLGVGGTPASAERAGRLGLPMVLGLIGGDIRRARPLVEHYRTVGQAAGHPAEALKLGLTSHFYVGKTSQGAREELYPHYREYLRPKTPGGRGWLVGPDEYRTAAGPFGALMAGSPQEVIDKILTEHELLGIDRFMGQIDFGGMPAHMVSDSIELLATEVTPVVRQETRGPGGSHHDVLARIAKPKRK
ncbi:alkanesulfonate monooxygenase SsuD/methylene tetrahydromethanopterin reductase-like flavin-dependent oxidoreductase (luciferase family) [Streptomyces sp. LBL]|uniref:LLM class flavin-dependent oxidoreductase n=1 Tax=Streptomyces sp. LBL TaxID=2940562 RepID=UPI002474244E|nr:LLM class flavin-dependent oxidoreductase [Streptomyces sp. LBL]MDH6622653.1 alkanesulfonate monooxygenase SsuD/methylene tetrahydromethanopterin reductase-like flavin-dependent oxidoreductase (luciferase family) [Streptomyces sp. LBL]